MKSRARIHTHPIHPMMVAIPIGLWVFSFVADVLYLIGLDAGWRMVSAYSMAGGCVGALLAAIPGFIDYFALEDSISKRIATWHMAINLLLVGLYALNFYIRYVNEYEVAGLAFGFSISGMIFLSISGWLGGDLVYVHKVGVIEEGRESGALR